MLSPPLRPDWDFQRLDLPRLGVTREQIAAMAERLYREAGAVPDHSLDFWLEAERRLWEDYLPRPAVRRLGGEPPTAPTVTTIAVFPEATVSSSASSTSPSRPKPRRRKP